MTGQAETKSPSNRQDLLDFAMQSSEGIFNKEGHLQTIVFAAFKHEGEDSIAMCPLIFGSVDEKLAIYSALRTQFKLMGVTAYVSISEAWMKSMTLEEAAARNGRQIETYDDRQEVVFYAAVDRDGHDVVMKEIVRPFDGSPATLGPANPAPMAFASGDMLSFLD